jgi:methionyl-tRNA formyltransferase
LRRLRIIYAGTPEFARVALQRLHAAGHEIALALTQPDRPAGRGMKLQASAVKQFALEHGLQVAQPRSLRLDGKYPQDAEEARRAIVSAKADVMVVAAYGLLLPQWVLDDLRSAPGQLGCLNIHGSLLPRWRGAAPIHRAIEAGDRETGVTIMQMDVGLDTGDMLVKQALTIEDHDSTATLHDKLAELGGTLVLEALEAAATGRLQPQAQPEAGVTYAHKVDKQEAAIDWSLPAHVTERRIRAFNPFPGATFTFGSESIKVWRAEVGKSAAEAAPGTVLAAGPAGIDVATGEGVLRMLELQRPGGRRLSAADFLRGFALTPGMRLVPDEAAG